MFAADRWRKGTTAFFMSVYDDLTAPEEWQRPASSDYIRIPVTEFSPSRDDPYGGDCLPVGELVRIEPTESRVAVQRRLA